MRYLLTNSIQMLMVMIITLAITIGTANAGVDVTSTAIDTKDDKTTALESEIKHDDRSNSLLDSKMVNRRIINDTLATLTDNKPCGVMVYTSSIRLMLGNGVAIPCKPKGIMYPMPTATDKYIVTLNMIPVR